MSMLAATPDPQNASPNPTFEQPTRCPKCGKHTPVQLIRAMRRYSGSDDWFRCDQCDHLFTRPRADQSVERL